jgi:hypothetical protein
MHARIRYILAHILTESSKGLCRLASPFVCQGSRFVVLSPELSQRRLAPELMATFNTRRGSRLRTPIEHQPKSIKLLGSASWQHLVSRAMASAASFFFFFFFFFWLADE